MNFLTFLMVYGGGFGGFLLIMLFGEQPMFAGTPIATAHYVVSAGPCDAIQWLLNKCCGTRGDAFSNWCAATMCETRTPFLQIVYLLLLGGAYYLYSRHIFSLLPLPGLPLWHIYTGSAALLLCVAAFAAASFSDPGFVTPANVQAHISAVPYDGVICRRKLCSTCKLQRPARAKHCSMCGGCIARFDHHCAWINNCVGANNLRFFLAFLMANCILSGYGVALIWSALRGELQRRNVWQYRIIDYDGSHTTLADSPAILVEWVVAHYTTAVFLGIILAAACFMMACFALYHLWLIHSGMTTYETSKWREIQLNAQTYDDAAVGNAGSAHSVWRCTRLLPRLRGGSKASLPPNIYKREFWANVQEVLFPAAMLHQTVAASAASVRDSCQQQAASVAAFVKTE